MIRQTRIIRNQFLRMQDWLRHSGRPAARMVLAAVVAGMFAGCATPPPPVEPPAAPVAVVPAPPLPVARPPRVALVLGGGAARGFAHVGVIQVLEEAGIRPDMVVGTSAGSLVAAIYASGKSGSQLQQIATDMEEAMLTDWTLPLFGRGVLRGDALARYVNQQVDGRPMESFSMPLGIVATDLRSGEGILFRRGDAGAAVRASSAVPSIFQPVRIGTREFVDGGLVAPVPVRYARSMGAEVVIAVDISNEPSSNSADGALQVLLQTFAIMGKSINAFELRDADVVVRPLLGDVRSADFAARRRSIEAGRAAMRAALPAYRARLAAFRAG